MDAENSFIWCSALLQNRPNSDKKYGFPPNYVFISEPSVEMENKNLSCSGSGGGICISYENYNSSDLSSIQSESESEYLDVLESSTESTVTDLKRRESCPSEGDGANFEARSSNSIPTKSAPRYLPSSCSVEARNLEPCKIYSRTFVKRGIKIEVYSQKRTLPFGQNINDPFHAGDGTAGFILKKTGTQSCESLAPSERYKNPEMEHCVKFVDEGNIDNRTEEYSPTRDLPFIENEVDPIYSPIKLSELISLFEEFGRLELPEKPIVSYEAINLPLLSAEILSSYDESNINTSSEKRTTEGPLGKTVKKVRKKEKIVITEKVNEAYSENPVNDLSETRISDIITSSKSLPKGNETDQLSTPTIIECSVNTKCRYTPSGDVTTPTDDAESSTSNVSLDLECELVDTIEELMKRRRFITYAHMVFQNDPIIHFSEELATKYLKKFSSKTFSFGASKECPNKDVTYSEVSTASRDDSPSLLEPSDENMKNIGQIPSEVENGSSVRHETAYDKNKNTLFASSVESDTNASAEISSEILSSMEHLELKSGGSHEENQNHLQIWKLYIEFIPESYPVAKYVPSNSINVESDNPPNDANQGCISEYKKIRGFNPKRNITVKDFQFNDNDSAECAVVRGKLYPLDAEAKDLLSHPEYVKKYLWPLAFILRNEHQRLYNNAVLDIDERQKSSAISLSANSSSVWDKSEIPSRHHSGAQASELTKPYCCPSTFFLTLDIDESLIHSTVPCSADTIAEQSETEVASQLNSDADIAMPRRRQQKSRRQKKKKGKRR